MVAGPRAERRTPVFAVSCLAALALAGADAKVPVVSDLHQLQGVWEVVEVGKEGQMYPLLGKTFVLICGHQVAAAGQDLGGIREGRLEIDQRHRTVDLQGDGQLLGIYELHGDRLTVCIAEEKVRPESLAPDKDRWLFRLRRLAADGTMVATKPRPAKGPDEAQERLEALKKQLPALLRKYGEYDDSNDDYVVRIARRTSPTQAKIVIADRSGFTPDSGLMIYLGFCDGHWTTVRHEGTGDFGPQLANTSLGQREAEMVHRLMRAIDEASDRPTR
jgi:uncharacterized protein (TIGR03067 family)